MHWRCLMMVCLASLAKGRLNAFLDSGETVELRDTSEVHVSQREVSNTCNNGYEDVTNSTLCATDSPNYVSGSAGVSAADQQLIIDKHNAYRAAVSPTATNMMKVYWDDELAKGAEKWARQCVAGHDSALKMSRYIPAYSFYPGQNGAFGHSNWESVVDSWHSEVHKYRYGEDPEIYIGKNGWYQVGHYTQIVTATVMRIGCGYAECTVGHKKFYFCNYITDQPDIIRPYNNGSSCADCPNSCKDNLCDCGDKFCFNRGTADIDACNCSCKYPFTGETCLTKSCMPKLDPDHCGTHWPPSYCTSGGVKEKCPVMCKVCPAPCNGMTCENRGKVEVSDCSCKCAVPWTGDKCEKKDCPNEPDPYYCGDWPFSYCATYPDYVQPKCPITCKLCPPIKPK